jgi:hypothetical protein
MGRIRLRLSVVGLAFLAFSISGSGQTAPGPAPAQAPAAQATPAQAAPAQAAPAQAAPAPPASANSPYVVPIDTTIPLVLKNTINSRTAYVGQAIYCETIFPVTVGNRIVIPVGSYVKGSLTEVKRAGRAKGRAEIGFRFDTITLPEGTTSSLRATLSGFAGTGNEGFKKNESKVEGQSSTGEKAGKVAEGAATGAEVGTIVGASRVSVSPTKNGGVRVGNSALAGLGIGAAAGAAGGLIWALAGRGKDIVLPSGTNLELQLSQPLTFERYEVQPHSRYDEGPALPRREYGPGL